MGWVPNISLTELYIYHKLKIEQKVSLIVFKTHESVRKTQLSKCFPATPNNLEALQWKNQRTSGSTLFWLKNHIEGPEKYHLDWVVTARLVARCPAGAQTLRPPAPYTSKPESYLNQGCSISHTRDSLQFQACTRRPCTPFQRWEVSTQPWRTRVLRSWRTRTRSSWRRRRWPGLYRWSTGYELASWYHDCPITPVSGVACRWVGNTLLNHF